MENQLESSKNIRTEPLASEIYGDLKAELRFKNKVIYILIGIIVGLAVALLCVDIYHNWLWAQFDTITLDAGGGYSNLVQGDNGGGIYNGQDQSAPEKEWPG